MRALLDLGFAVAWTLLLAVVVRTLVLLRATPRTATLTALAVAAAFFAGTLVPFAQRRGPEPVAPQPAAQPATAVGPAAGACDPRAALRPGALGHIDTIGAGDGAPAPAAATLSVPAGSALQVAGWAATSAGPGAGACIIEDGRALGVAVQYGLARGDVAAALGRPAFTRTGYIVSIPGTFVTAGTHALAVAVVDANGRVLLAPGAVSVSAR